ncbi:VOC family protein [Actinoallomurus soli]|uniref:VOC family protein n=1 Tax=Actinoallomurus soli TaxID=2952535 RepID=UPI0020939A05|nr:VOC family protein [Actinoallomurus soli]MCO5971177.1 glyoxalase/bleomycin resistance/extradiol dioxygenase family protein [Actinoallomurus soli]
MDALYPRLLVGRFTECFGFYDAVLPELTGATLARGGAAGPYASWDVEGEGALALFDRAAMAAAAGTADLPAEALAQDRAMLAGRVADVDAGYEFCLRHGARAVAAPADRPEWGPNLRNALVRDPDGNLLELQSY